jgi:hypothetical protein
LAHLIQFAKCRLEAFDVETFDGCFLSKCHYTALVYGLQKAAAAAAAAIGANSKF